VYSELGYGFLEKLYQRAMAIALTEAGLFVSRDTRFDVMFRGHCLGQFFADLIVENRVLLEIKATSALQPSDEAQVLNYLRASTIELALLLNFGPKRELKRRVLTNDRKGASPRIDGET
jgi:GxxExxY protein